MTVRHEFSSRTWIALLALLATAVAVSGCGRSLGSMVGSKDAEARSGIVWNVPAPFLEPQPASNRTVYVRWRNISGTTGVNLQQDIKDALSSAGYTIVDDPSAAHYRLRSVLRYFGENEAGDMGRGMAAGLGAISGAAVGGVSGRAIGGGPTSTVIGAGAGAGLGALAGAAISNAMEVTEWNLIVDLVLEEYHPGGVEFEVASAKGRASDTGTSNVTATPGGSTVQGVSGGEMDRTARTTTITQKSNYFPHGMRITAWARQIGMTEEEALPELKGRLIAALPNIVP